MLLSMSGVAGAQRSFVAMNYSPFHQRGEHPGVPIPDEQIVKDLKVIADAGFSVIKTYGVDRQSNLFDVVPLIAQHKIDLKVYQGVYESPEYNSSGQPKTSTKYLDDAVFLANKYPNIIEAIIVGNECLHGDPNPSITANQLAADIAYVRKRLNKGSKVLVSTEFTYGGALNYGQQLENSVDFMMINIYPFFAGPGESGIPVNQAADNLISAYQMFAGKFSKQVMIGETGWPSQGPRYGQSVPSVANEKIFSDGVVNSINALGPTFLFLAYDSPWLIAQTPWGPYWGLWTTTRTPKFAIPKP